MERARSGPGEENSLSTLAGEPSGQDRLVGPPGRSSRVAENRDPDCP